MSVFGTAFSWSDNTSTFADGCTNNLSAEFKSYFAANGTYNGLCMPSDHAYLADCSHPWVSKYIVVCMTITYSNGDVKGALAPLLILPAKNKHPVKF